MYYLEQIEPRIWPDYTRSVLGASGSFPHGSGSVAVGARLSGEPVGLTLAQANQYDLSTAVVKLCAVARRHRRAGIGLALLQRVESVLASKGYERGECWVKESSPAKAAVSRLLSRASWPELQPWAYLCETNYETLRHASWMQIPFPEHFEKFHWSRLTAADCAVIAEGRERGLFPRSLDPMRIDFATAEMPPGSIGFRHQGRLAGWCVAQYTGQGKAEVVSLFADPILRRPAFAINALAEGIRMTPGCDYFFDVSFEREGMKRFVDRRMLPYLTSVTRVLRSAKSLQH